MKKKMFFVKNRGFTLIELLAVIVILAIILLIAMPIVLNVINDARKRAFEVSAQGLVKTAENEYMMQEILKASEYTFENGEQTSEDKLKFYGKPPNNGRIIIRQDGKVAMGIEDGTWCIQKAFDSSETTVTLLEEMEEDCDVTDFVGTVTWSINENEELVATLPLYSGGDFEYSIDGETWQSSNVFEDLTSGVDYIFYVRIDGSVVNEIDEEIAPEVYVVTYTSGSGGSITSASSEIVIYGEQNEAPDISIDEGHEFGNFTIDEGACAGNFASATGVCSSIEEEITIHANFTPNTYTINYTASEGGDVNISYRTVTHGSSADEPGYTVEEGYSFVDFEAIENASNGVLDSSTGALTNISGNMTIQANFTVNEYTVTYTSSSGGSVNPTSEIVDWSDANSGTIPNANTGYTFNNYTLESGECYGSFSLSTGICDDVREDITIKANFTINTYVISCSVGSGSGSVVGDCDVSINHGSSATVTALPDEGYEFDEWTGDASGTNTEYTFSSVTSNKSVTANFESSGFSCGDTLIDSRDDKEYGTVQIGDQCWMDKNLAYTGNNCLNQEWSSHQPYNACRTHDMSWGEEVLYQWDAAMNWDGNNPSEPDDLAGDQGLCPTGWHVPTDEEWQELELALGMSESEVNTIGLRGETENVGAKLKSENDWDGTNESGFDGLPAGLRGYQFGTLVHEGDQARWWTSSANVEDGVWYRSMGTGFPSVYRDQDTPADAISLRCLLD